METVVADVNASDIPIVSIDLPSGLSADTPHLIGDCIDASMTVTLAAPKLPLVLPPGEAHAGDVVIADIGIPQEVIDALEGPRIELLTPEQMRELVEPRAADSHKGDFGRVTIVAGSTRQDRRGAPGGHGRAAIGRGPRDGRDAGLVPAHRGLDGAGVHDASRCRTIAAWWRRPRSIGVLELTHDVIACGPGLGEGRVSPSSCARCSIGPRAARARRRRPHRARRRSGALTGREERDVIITPHPGEMARLIGAR